MAREIIRDPVIAQRMKIAFELFETGQLMMRQNLRRKFPHLNDAEIEQRLIEWRHHRPGAEFGDAEGRLVPKERMAEWLGLKES